MAIEMVKITRSTFQQQELIQSVLKNIKKKTNKALVN